MIKIDRRLIKNFDWITFLCVVVLTAIGIVTIYSATRPIMIDGEAVAHPDYYLKQIVWLLIGLTAMFAIISIDYIWLFRFSYFLYAIGLLLLVIVLFAGKTTMGAQRWISLGPISFQPSEFFRLLFIIGFSSYLSNQGANHGHNQTNGLSGNLSVKSLFIFAILPLVLVINQPDLGTAILLMSLFAALSIAKGLSRKLLTTILLIAVISGPFLGPVLWNGLKDYQKNRIIAFIDPAADPSGIGYHIAQSKITIGSGGALGKGYFNGTQGPLRFLPEKHTDFVFSVFAEEWGFLGSLVLLSIYLILFLRGLDTALKAKDEVGRLIATGITAMFFVYFSVNIGMTLGMMPVVGVPLPFVSYGGTALLSNFIAAGILINIRIRRFELFYP